MKRITILLAILISFSNPVLAQTSKADLIGLGMAPELANEIVKGLQSSGSSVIGVDGDPQRIFTFDASSDTALTMKFGDGGTTAVQQIVISGSTADADDDAQLLLAGGGTSGASRGGTIYLYGNENSGNGGVDIYTGSDSGADINLSTIDDVIFILGQDANRLVSFDAAADTQLDMTFGDGGTTAAQIFTISASTADADDDSSLLLSGGGGKTAAVSTARGAYIQIYGNESSGQLGQLYLTSGNVASSDVTVVATDDVLLHPGGALKWTADETGQLIGAGTATIGWTIQAAANQACSTTCVTPCVFGQETTSKAILACSDATADSCLCAGAS